MPLPASSAVKPETSKTKGVFFARLFQARHREIQVFSGGNDNKQEQVVADLSQPADRKLIQMRTIDFTGYIREDGLWDIEAHLVDTRTKSLSYARYGVPKPPGHPIHEMKIRLTVDDDVLIHEAEAATLNAPFDTCSVPPAVFPKLKGLSLNKGWKERVYELMGGTKGCTHLLELLGNLATVAHQTVSSSDKYLEMLERGEDRPFFVHRCYTYDESGPVIEKLFPNFFKPQDQE
jgi:hypothetical protein